MQKGARSLRSIVVLLAAAVFLGGPAALSTAGPRKDGAALYRKHCSSCHPDATRLLPIDDLLHRLRFPLPGMPTFSVKKLSDDEVGAVGEYIRSADGKAARPRAASLKQPSDAQAPPGTGAGANRATKAEKHAQTAAPWNRLLAGKWTIRCRQNDGVVTIRQFAVDSDGNGEPEIVLSNAPSGYAVKVTAFELTKKKLKLELTWSWDLNSNYWKTEAFDLRLSGNGRRLAGSYALRTSGGQSADSTVWGE